MARFHENQDDGAQRWNIVSQDRLSRLRPAEEFLKSDLAKQVRDKLEQAQREEEENPQPEELTLQQPAQQSAPQPPQPNTGEENDEQGMKPETEPEFNGEKTFTQDNTDDEEDFTDKDDFSDEGDKEKKPGLKQTDFHQTLTPRHKYPRRSERDKKLSPRDREESLIKKLVHGDIALSEAVGLLDPATMIDTDEYKPTLDEVFNSLILRINVLDLLDYYLTASIEDDLMAILVFFDASMEDSKAARLLTSFREIMPGSQVIQRPEDGCWVFLSTEKEIDVLGTGEAPAPVPPPAPGSDSRLAKNTQAADSGSSLGDTGGLGGMPPMPSGATGELVSVPGAGAGAGGGEEGDEDFGAEIPPVPEPEEGEEGGGEEEGGQVAPPGEEEFNPEEEEVPPEEEEENKRPEESLFGRRRSNLRERRTRGGFQAAVERLTEERIRHIEMGSVGDLMRKIPERYRQDRFFYTEQLQRIIKALLSGGMINGGMYGYKPLGGNKWEATDGSPITATLVEILVDYCDSGTLDSIDADEPEDWLVVKSRVRGQEGWEAGGLRGDW